MNGKNWNIVRFHPHFLQSEYNQKPAWDKINGILEGITV